MNDLRAIIDRLRAYLPHEDLSRRLLEFFEEVELEGFLTQLEDERFERENPEEARRLREELDKALEAEFPPLEDVDLEEQGGDR